MQVEDLVAVLSAFTNSSSLNKVKTEDEYRLFDSPLVGFADANDDLFCQLKLQSAVGPQHLTPSEWLPGAQTVISFFLPFSSRVRTSNRTAGEPSLEWLYGRIEGQAFVVEFGRFLVSLLQQQEHQAIFPTIDPRFNIIHRRSNWSERHVAFIAGLGTISLNRSLITKSGSAGRLGSVITNRRLPASERYYSAFDENCNHCGACIRRCPPGAINEDGKDHALCDAYLETMKQRFSPRYGCGKCQTGVPCEQAIPARRFAKGAHSGD